MESKNPKRRRERRTKAVIEEVLWKAVENQIIKKGINNLTIIGIAQEAKIEPPVIYNRFKNLNDILEKYIRKYDYWLNDIIKIVDKKSDPKDCLKKIFTKLIEELYKNEVMQKILLWELSDTNPIANRSSTNRELYSGTLFRYFNETLEKADIEPEPFFAIIIGGIYYSILHRKVSTFCKIDFNTDNGKEILIDTIDKIIETSFKNKK